MVNTQQNLYPWNVKALETWEQYIILTVKKIQAILECTRLSSNWYKSVVVFQWEKKITLREKSSEWKKSYDKSIKGNKYASLDDLVDSLWEEEITYLVQWSK